MWHAVRHQRETRSMTSAHRAPNKATESGADLGRSPPPYGLLSSVKSSFSSVSTSRRPDCWNLSLFDPAKTSRVSVPELLTARCGFRVSSNEGTDWWVQGLLARSIHCNEGCISVLTDFFEPGHRFFIGQCRDKSSLHPCGYIYDALLLLLCRSVVCWLWLRGVSHVSWTF